MLRRSSGCDVCAVGLWGVTFFVFLPAICSSVSWSACGWKEQRQEKRNRVLQMVELLNDAPITIRRVRSKGSSRPAGVRSARCQHSQTSDSNYCCRRLNNRSIVPQRVGMVSLASVAVQWHGRLWSTAASTNATDADCIHRLYSKYLVAKPRFMLRVLFWSADTGVHKIHNKKSRLAAVGSFQENKLTTGCLSCTNMALKAALRVQRPDQ